MKLNEKTYNILKWVSIIALDAIGVFYATAAKIWGLPFGDSVAQTLDAIGLLIGTLIGVSTHQYNKAKEVKGAE